MNLLNALLSKDPTRIWSAACAIRTLRDPDALAALATHIVAIKTATKGIDLGGAVRPNASHLDFALRKLEFVRAGRGCLCQLYPEDDFYDPQREADAGHVEILDTIVNVEEWKHAMICRCLQCGQRYTADERHYHYIWWEWVPIEAAG
jgi:hypothetical protein